MSCSQEDDLPALESHEPVLMDDSWVPEKAESVEAGSFSLFSQVLQCQDYPRCGCVKGNR